MLRAGGEGGETTRGSNGGVATQSGLCHWPGGGIPAQRGALGRGCSAEPGLREPLGRPVLGEGWAGLNWAELGWVELSWAGLAASGDQREGRKGGRKEGSGSQRMKSEKWQRFALEAAVRGYLRTVSGSTGWLLGAFKKKKKKIIQLMGAPPKQTRYPFHRAVPVEKGIILH